MPGAWEQRPGVLVCVLKGRESVSAEWADAWRNLQFPPQSNYMKPAGMPFDHARNIGCDTALENGYSHIFFLDDDVIAPHDAILRLLSHKRDIVSGVYYRRSPPIGVPVMLRYIEGGTQYVTQFKWPDLIPVDLVGAGCLLISRTVLEAMKAKGGHHPFFDWRSDRTDLPPLERTSEDFTFCVRAKREFGFEILVDTSVRCHHVGMAKACIDGENKPAFMPL